MQAVPDSGGPPPPVKTFGKGSRAAPAFGLAALSSPRAQPSVPALAMPSAKHGDAAAVPAGAPSLTAMSEAVVTVKERVEATPAAEAEPGKGKRQREGDDDG